MKSAADIERQIRELRKIVQAPETTVSESVRIGGILQTLKWVLDQEDKPPVSIALS